MNLKEILKYLEEKDRDIIVPVGFDEPHSYRGDYRCLAFEPAGDVTVGAMLQCARSAVGTTYRNWLDDEYQMHGGTEVYLAMSGCVGEKIGGVLLDYMTGVYDDEEIKTPRRVINRSTDQIVGLKAEIGHLRTSLEFADDTIKDLTVERNTIGADLVTADRIIHKLKAKKDNIEDRRRIDSLVKERNELNRWFINDRDTLRSIERICAELEMRDPQFISHDVQAIKSMKRISNIMEGWDPDIGREKEFDGHISKSIELVSIGLVSVDEMAGKISDQNKTIENKVSTISWLEDRIDNQMKRLQSRSKEIETLKTELAIRNVPAMKESLKDGARLALRQDDKITALKAEVSRLRGIIRAEHDHNADLLGGNKSKFHKIVALEAELVSVKSDRDIVLQNDRNTVAKLQNDIGGLEAELSARKEDSAVLMKVVEIVKNLTDGIDDHTNSGLMQVYGLIKDYIDAPEGPHEVRTAVFEVECPVDGSRTIHLQKMRIAEQKQTIEKLKADSEVLMRVVNVVRDWDDSTGRAFPTLYKIVDLLVDYTDIPDGDGGDE